MEVRAAQLATFNEQRLQSFVERVAQHLEVAAPEFAYGRSADEVRAFIHSAIAQAGEFGITREDCVARYVMYRIDFGAQFESDPAWRWVLDILHDPDLSEGEKIDSIDAVAFGGPIVARS